MSHGTRPCSNLPQTRNNIIQKGLAFVREQSGSVTVPDAEGAPRSRPAGLMAEMGLRRCGAKPLNRTEDLMSKQRSTALSNATTATPSQQPAAAPKSNKTASGSKQARVIAMLQSPAGTTITAMMKATGWQQHSVRGFLAGVVRKRLKLKLDSEKIDGNRVYQIASAEGTKPSRSRKSTRQSS